MSLKTNYLSLGVCSQCPGRGRELHGQRQSSQVEKQVHLDDSVPSGVQSQLPNLSPPPGKQLKGCTVGSYLLEAKFDALMHLILTKPILFKCH